MATSKSPKECYIWDAQVPLKHLLVVERGRDRTIRVDASRTGLMP